MSGVAAAGPAVLPFRVGHGFDLHRLEPNLKLIIGGVDIPHDRGCDAHSDGRRGTEQKGGIQRTRRGPHMPGTRTHA